jgi:hypothetical protein
MVVIKKKVIEAPPTIDADVSVFLSKISPQVFQDIKQLSA